MSNSSVLPSTGAFVDTSNEHHVHPFIHNTIDTAFNSINDDDFFDTAGPSLAECEANVTQNDTFFDNHVSDSFNSLSQEFEYDFDVENQLQSPSSEYLTLSQFNNVVKEYDDTTFSLIHFNIRSINKHFEELQLFLNKPIRQKFSVIGLTETWLSQDSSLPYALDGYDFVVNIRQHRVGGGVALYVSQMYDYVVRDELNSMTDSIESLFIEISVPGSKNIIIGVVYRPPNTNTKSFLDYFSDLVKNPIFIHKKCFIMGDFNIDLLKQNNMSQDFLEIFLSASFLPLISKPTRIVNESATLIDNIFL